MPELLEEQRESWGTRGGFILAAIGSAVGLGNLWAFPYKLYSYGGGAFLIPYITAIFCIGIPMLILEFSLGHLTQRAAPEAFRRVNRKAEFVGWWGIILGFVIITYYPVILAYCLSFMYYSIEGIFNGGNLPWAGQGIEGVEKAKEFFYDSYLGYTEGVKLGAIRFNILIPLGLIWLAMYFCIFKGVNLVSKIVWITVPLPWLMLLVLTVRGLTLPGSMKGLVYYLEPAWSELAKPTTWRFAFGQVFFSLSLAFGVMLTYASFLHRKSDINNNATIISLADLGTSFIAGLAIFSTLGGMAYVSQQAGNAIPVEKVAEGGPGLAFVAFPYALAQLPGSAWWSFIFFFTLITLGVDSGFSIPESVLAGIVDKTGWNRSIVLAVMSIVGLLSGIVYVTNGGLNWVGTIDSFINGTWGIAFLGLLECVVLGWIYKIDKLRLHANERSDWQIGPWWNYAVKIFIPIVLGTLFVWSLSDDLSTTGGFLRGQDGKWILPNCVGLAVVATAPIVALFMSSIKTAPRNHPYPSHLFNDKKDFTFGTKLGFAAFSLTSLSMVSILIVFLKLDPTFRWYWHIAITAFILAIIALVASDVVLRKQSNLSFCWFARFAGILSTLDISAALALVLIYLTDKAQTGISIHSRPEHLGGTSYVILCVVFIMLIIGLGWCFYKAMLAAGKNAPEQKPEENEE